MKCPYCGGEVPAQSVACPFCGQENPEGIAFQREVQKKIERNKLLKPFLIKQKTPELIQRMMTRIIIIIVVVNVALLGFSFLLTLWSAGEERREPAAGSYAELYLEEFRDLDDFYFNDYYRELKKQVEMLDSGEMPEEYEIINLVDNAHRALEESQDERMRTAIYQYEVAFFRGFLGLTEEESSFLEPDEDGEYGSMFSDDERAMIAVDAIREKYEEVQ